MLSRVPVKHAAGRIRNTLRKFLDNTAAGGLVLMATAALAIVIANSPLAPAYFAALKTSIGPLSLLHWINDALMALFFLMVGLEIKREMLDGRLATWPRRILPGVAAACGMAVPGLIYAALNAGHPDTLRGWAIPAATDIAFALGVLSLLGPRVPVSLKIFLATLAILDDLGAVAVIAVFYTDGLSVSDMLGAAVVIGLLMLLNRGKVQGLRLYLLLGVVLWILVFRSGIHATIAGVLLALTIPIRLTPAAPEALPATSPLHRLEQALHRPVAFLVVPVFGFANAGVSFAGVGLATFAEPVTLGIAAGLVLGKLVGVFGAVAVMVRLRLADLPAEASWAQVFGVALLCGIGFTMSLFIGMLAFDDPALQDEVKLGILTGSGVAGAAGYLVLRFSSRDRRGAA